MHTVFYTLLEQPREMCHCWECGDEPSADPQQPPERQAQEPTEVLGIPEQPAPQSGTAAGLSQNGLSDLRETQRSYESSGAMESMMDIYLRGIQTGREIWETTCGCPPPPCCNYCASTTLSLQDI